MKPILSIIMPVYNAEKVVGKAIESVISQTRKDIEIVIVNDGSKDSSGKIIERFVAEDSRVIYVNKEKNAGLSAARNSGLEVISGDYFTFVDADDWVEPDFYEKLLALDTNADVIVTGFFHDTLDKDGNVSVSVQNSTGETKLIEDKIQILDKMAQLDRNRLFAFTWNKLYKKSFIESLDLVFKNQTLIEDYQYNCFVFDKVEKLALVDGCFYHYNKFSEEALTQKYLPDYFEIIDKRYVLMKELFERYDVFEGENRATICSMHIKHVFAGFIKNCSPKSGLSFKQQIKIIKNVFKDENCKLAVKYATSTRKQELLCNYIFSTKIAVLNYFVARLLYTLQNSKRNIFDKLK